MHFFQDLADPEEDQERHEQNRRADDRQRPHPVHPEATLDGLLNFCGHAAVLQLYRRLCRHYHGFNPAGAASYVHAFRAMYGDGDPSSNDLG